MISDDGIAHVADILCSRGLVQEARALTLTSKGVMVEMGKLHFYQLNQKYNKKDRRKSAHPLQALEDTMHCLWKRACVAYAIRLDAGTLLPVMHSTKLEMGEFFSMYREDIKGKLNLARETHPNAKYTFHLVYNLNVMQLLSKNKKKDQHSINDKKLQRAVQNHGGDMAVHRFVCMPDLVGALFFFHRWSMAQSGVEGKKATCLMECGPSDETMRRKWIIDIDAAYKDLKALKLLLDPSVCSEQVCLDSFTQIKGMNKRFFLLFGPNAGSSESARCRGAIGTGHF